jgi:D-threo-aldose 1-dehydrogenase
MAFDPLQRVPIGRTGLAPTRLGFGTAEIGGLFRAVSDEAAAQVIDHAWQIGIRYFDSAPLYGYGNAERRLGAGLRERPRDDFVLSTKVGRVLVPIGEVEPGADIDRQARDGIDDASYKGTPPVRVVFDYSFDGVMRSVEDSLRRLGLDRVDILYIHDPDDHWEDAIKGAYPALDRLRREGVVRAIGAGMNQAEMLARFAREGDFDVFLVAGRYTILDQAALAELLPLCVAKGIAVVAGGVMNSGILADPRPGAMYNYAPAPPELIERAQRIRAVCDRHAVSLRAAAIQFPLAHPAVAALAAGVRTIEHLTDYPRSMTLPIPDDLWAELRAEGLIRPDAPVPIATDAAAAGSAAVPPTSPAPDDR